MFADWWWVIAASAAVLTLLVLLVVRSHRARIVSSESGALDALKQLNEEYLDIKRRLPPIKMRFEERVNSKAKLERFDLRLGLLTQIAQHEHTLRRLVADGQERTKRHSQYLGRCSALAAEQLGKSSSASLESEVFNRTESTLFRRRQLRAASPQAAVMLVVGYTSPKGQNAYARETSIDFSGLSVALSELTAINQARSTTQFLRRQERNRMTTSLRYQILKRDGNRCVACGRAVSDGVKLHVDHIVPVAKGGRTVERNLQTLCQDCNLGKSYRH